MYRFLLLQDISLTTGFFVSKKTTMQRTLRTCSFCNFHHAKTPKQLHAPGKKKMKQKSKKYAELLEVTSETTSNKRASVKKLNMAQMSALVNEADITMDKLHKLKDRRIRKEYSAKCEHLEGATPFNKEMLFSFEEDDELSTTMSNDDKVSNDMYSLDFENLMDEINLSENYEASESFANSLSPRMDLTGHRRKKSFYRDTKFVKKLSKEYIMTLTAHLDVYISCGMLDEAYNTLMGYRTSVLLKMEETDKIYEGIINAYNIVLDAFALKGDLEKNLQIYNSMKSGSILPTSVTYAVMFESYIKSSTKSFDVLQMLKEDMDKYKINYNDIFCKTQFRESQSRFVLEAVKLLQPDFEPKYLPPDTNYKCKLVTKIPMKNKYESPAAGLFTINELQELVKQQIDMECQHKVVIDSIKKFGDTKTLYEYKDILLKLEARWRDDVSKAFDRMVNNLVIRENNMGNNKLLLYPFFKVLSKEEYVDAVLQEIKEMTKSSPTYSTSVSLLYTRLAMRIYRRYEILVKERCGILAKTVDIYVKYLDWYLNNNNNICEDGNNRTVWQNLEHQERENDASLNRIPVTWTKDLVSTIGKTLYSIVFDAIKIYPDIVPFSEIKQPIPAFYSLYRQQTNYSLEQIKPHPIITQLYKDSQSESLMFEPTLLPSYIPPRPWSTITSGGYLLSTTTFMRIKLIGEPFPSRLETTDNVQLYPVFDSLNQLSAVPWKVNTDILDIIIKVFQNGGSDRLNIPRPPSALEVPELSPNATKLQKAAHVKLLLRHKRKKYDMYSLWCDTLYKLSLANHYRDKIFWLPHNLDFRGRVYPVPPHLNHLTSDLGRSILMFAKGKPLGPNGLDWLKIHTINLTGLKKGCTLKEGLEFANANLDKILDSARKPLTGEMWWTKAEEQWQTLAGCIEIEKALQSENVEEYICHFPVHQDGSCNGLQHYAALGKDQIGAESVNLYPRPQPNDVYATVAALIEEKRKKDEADKKEIAKHLKGFIKRKVIKQTVMTTVYGVTQFGAKYQILRQLKDKEFPNKHAWAAAVYLTETTFNTLRTMFRSAKQIQDWFTKCANIISQTCGQNVEWVTPLGLPVVQVYQKSGKIKNQCTKPDTMKHRNAFPPNFIHSLDSTHMMLTSLHCNKAGLTFVSVHDCFWTHPCDIHIMNKICRQQFVALHSEPILYDLSAYFVQRYLSKENVQKLKLDKAMVASIRRNFVTVPQLGKFDITKVLESTYFFS